VLQVEVDRQIPPRSPGVAARPVSGHGHGAGVVLRLRRRADDDSPAGSSRPHQSVILYDKQEMSRRARQSAGHRLRRLKSTPSYHLSSPSVESLWRVLYSAPHHGC